jgi:hypothetical protein
MPFEHTHIHCNMYRTELCHSYTKESYPMIVSMAFAGVLQNMAKSYTILYKPHAHPPPHPNTDTHTQVWCTRTHTHMHPYTCTHTYTHAPIHIQIHIDYSTCNNIIRKSIQSLFTFSIMWHPFLYGLASVIGEMVGNGVPVDVYLALVGMRGNSWSKHSCVVVKCCLATHSLPAAILCVYANQPLGGEIFTIIHVVSQNFLRLWPNGTKRGSNIITAQFLGDTSAHST